MTNEVLLDKREDGVAIVTLNRPEAMNALNKALREKLSQIMIDIKNDDSIKCVILTGAGDRAFTAGLDLRELGADTSNLGAANDHDPKSNPCKAIESCGKPVIGAINGVAITGGFEVALSCHILIASTKARFADTHALVGIMPGWGLSQKLSRIIGLGRAREMSYSGVFIDAQTALNWGLVNHVVEPELLISKALELAIRIANVETKFLKSYENLISTGYEMPFSQALEFERLSSTLTNSKISADDVETRRNAVMEKGRKQV